MDQGSLTRALAVISRPRVPAVGVPPAAAAPVPPAPAIQPAADRVQAHPVMGQAPQAVPPPPAPPVAAQDKTTINFDSASTILAGLNKTLAQVDAVGESGWKCSGVDPSMVYKARVLRDRMAPFVAAGKSAATFVITSDEVNAADKVLGCSQEVTGPSSDKSAYVALGVILIGASVFLTIV